MEVTVLGSGTSHGVPVIGCSCPVCTSPNPKNKRTRASILIRKENSGILIDTSTDFRFQALREDIDSLDAILVTHAHADHIHGLDDIRTLSRQKPLPVYATESTLKEIQNRFDYIFKETQHGGGKPNIDLEILSRRPLNLGNIDFVPVPVKHGDLDIVGFRFGPAAYLTDCSFISEESYELLKGITVLIIGALRYRKHATHFSIDEAVDAARRMNAQRTFFTHLCHDVDHETLEQELPADIRPAYDGMKIEISL